ncbi:hypothetical protein [Nocardioides sp. Iso805N]|uniref:hypothetical protein n=1 Tax=Nocardioides sp. Iso805N TaxID=1283287 RepID=UPI0003A9515D|nr:hypothetical protein [Nocardioides sp. Iso805N]
MLVLGLVLLTAGALVLLAGVFTAGDSGNASLVGIHLGATAVFLLGVFSGVAILWGLSLARYGGRRQLRQRKEQRRLQGLAAKLERLEGEQREEPKDE